MPVIKPIKVSIPQPSDPLYVSPFTTVPASADIGNEVYETFNQAQEGSCTANALVGAAELILNRAKSPLHLSRQFPYYNARVKENQLGEGLYSCRDILVSATTQGICLESLWPYNPQDENILPSSAAYADALNRKLGRFELIQAPGIQEYDGDPLFAIKSAINEGLPVFNAMSVGSALYSLTGPWRKMNYVMTDMIGGHAEFIIGYDDTVGKLHIQNSWGSSWGDNGTWGIDYKWASIMELWVIRGFEGVEILPPPGIRLDWRNYANTNLIARVTPKPAEIGKSTNIWVGAMLSTGELFLKNNLVDDTWAKYEGQMIAAGSIVLQDDNDIVVVNDMGLAPFKGADVYVAYGDSPLNWTLEKVCTI